MQVSECCCYIGKELIFKSYDCCNVSVITKSNCSFEFSRCHPPDSSRHLSGFLRCIVIAYCGTMASSLWMLTDRCWTSRGRSPLSRLWMLSKPLKFTLLLVVMYFPPAVLSSSPSPFSGSVSLFFFFYPVLRPHMFRILAMSCAMKFNLQDNMFTPRVCFARGTR